MKKKVLIIEDDNDTSIVLGYLAEMLGLEFAVSNEVLPIADIVLHRPDMILVDHRLSNGFGGDLCYKIKSTPITSHICVILVSAHANIANIARDSCADYYIAKPFDLDAIEALMMKCLDLEPKDEF